MASTAGGQDRDWLWPMALVAVLAHGLLLLIVLPERDLRRQPPPALQWLELTPPETPDPAPIASTKPEDQPPPEPEPEEVAQASADPTLEPPADASAEAPDPAPAAPVAERLRELALIAAQAQAEPATPSSPGVEGFAAPRLPSAAGWLNDYVGTVTPEHDVWSNTDGSVGARRVTASGQVYCGHADAPSVDQLFNPSLGMPIMRWRKCGRLRPEPIDRTDPWVRGQGSRQR